MKNCTLHWRQYTSNVFQILTPVVCMLFIFLLQVIVNDVIGRMSRFRMENDVNNDDKGHRVYGIPVDLDIGIFMLKEMNFTTPTDILYTFNNDSSEIGNYINQIRVPMTTELVFKEDAIKIDEILFDDLELMEFNDSFVFNYVGAFKFTNLTNEFIEFTTQYEKNTESGLRGIFGTTKFCSMLGRIYNNEDILHCGFLLSTSLMNMVTSAIVSNFSNSYMEIETFVTQMDYYKPPEGGFEFNIADVLGLFFYPLILLLCLPPILYTIVIEKETELKEIMKLNGMKERNYIIATYCFEFFIYCISAAIFYFMGLILQYRFFTQTNGLILFLIFLGVGLTQVSMAFFLSSFISKSFIATIVGYLFVIFIPIAGILLNSYILLPGEYAYKFLLIIPFFPVTDIMFHSTQACGSLHCLSWDSFVHNYDFLIALIFLFSDALIYFLLSLYLDKITPKHFGVRKHPLYFLDWIFRKFKKEKTVNVESNESLDVDIGNEREKIILGEIDPKKEGIVVSGLIKHFGRGKSKNVAVDKSYFHVKKSECFGLLGPNGAGKTTTVNMISGMFSQTAGDAFVNGYSISTDMDLIHQSLGLCPQFSVLWQNLTPTEHLLFYTRLKGMAITKERSHVHSILSEVGLVGDGRQNFFQKILRFFFPKEKKAKALSGGMKRRLSIAISLCGDPEVLLLDEPTTGLDPLNRRDIWDVIKKQKKSRSVILTTYSMEEADALSDRIGIMSHGKLVCLGSSLHLKNRFGNGYVIKIKHEVDCSEGVINFVKMILKEADVSILKQFGNSITFEARPKDKPFSISKTFKEMKENKKKIGILDFEIQQTTLEDVFLNVIKKDEEKIISSHESVKDLGKVKEIEKIKIEDTEPPNEMSILLENEREIDKSISINSGININIVPPSFTQRINLYFKDCCCQIIYLSWKNFLLSIRGWKVSLLQILAPFFVVLLLFILTLVAQINMESYYVHPEVTKIQINKLRGCYSWGNVKCLVFAYSTNNNTFAEKIMNEIIVDYDVVDFQKFNYEEEMMNFIYDNPNKTQTAISFSNVTYYLKPPSMKRQNITAYTLYFNDTHDMVNQIEEFKLIIDNMIYYFSMEEIGETIDKKSINIKEQGYPKPPSKMAVSGQANIFSSTGPIFFCLISMIVFVVSLYQVVLEKENHLRTGLELIGMKKVSYFISWFITFIVFGVLVSISTIISGYAFVIDVFIYSNPLFMFLLLFTFTFSLINFGFALSPIFQKSKAALICGFIIIGLSFILNLFLANGTIIYLLFNLEDGYEAITYLFQILYAPFNFGKMFSDIVNHTVKVYDMETNTYSANTGYWWNEFFDENSNMGIDAPASFYSILYLLLNSLIYFVVFLYLDVVLPRPNYSGRYPWFFLNPSFWGINYFSKNKNYNNEDLEMSNMDEDLRKEYKETRKVENCAIRVLDAKKNYKKLLRKGTKALKGVNFHCETGTCLGLLGGL